jgi:magnesium transporter
MEVWWVDEAGAKAASEDGVRELASRAGGVVWVHLDHTDEPGLTLLQDLIPVRPHDLRDCYTRNPVPKLHAYADHHFSAINGLCRGVDGRLHFLPLKIFLAPRLLFTVFGPHHEALTVDAMRRDIDVVRQQLEASEFSPESAFDLVAAIRQEMLRSHEELVATGAARIAELELNVMRLDAIRAEALLGDLFGLRHDLQVIRTNAAQTHGMYEHLADRLDVQHGIMPLDSRRLHELRQSYRHLQNTTDLEREYLQEVLDLFQTRVSTELNRFVRKITAFGTIGISWTIIVGIYGMNFVSMPELTWRYGYFWAIGLMAAASAVLGVLFHRRGWL